MLGRFVVHNLNCVSSRKVGSNILFGLLAQEERRRERERGKVI